MLSFMNILWNIVNSINIILWQCDTIWIRANWKRTILRHVWFLRLPRLRVFFSVSPYWGCRILMGRYSHLHYIVLTSDFFGRIPPFILALNYVMKPFSLIRPLLFLWLLYVFQFFTRFKLSVLECKPLFLHLTTIYERTGWILSLFSKFSLFLYLPVFYVIVLKFIFFS